MITTKTLAVAAVVIAATASLALAPTFTSTAMAEKGGINHRECVHKGTGEPIECRTETHGKNFESSCKVRGEIRDPCPT